MDDTNEFGVPFDAQEAFMAWVREYIKDHPGLTGEELAERFLIAYEQAEVFSGS